MIGHLEEKCHLLVPTSNELERGRERRVGVRERKREMFE